MKRVVKESVRASVCVCSLEICRNSFQPCVFRNLLSCDRHRQERETFRVKSNGITRIKNLLPCAGSSFPLAEKTEYTEFAAKVVVAPDRRPKLRELCVFSVTMQIANNRQETCDSRRERSRGLQVKLKIQAFPL